MNTDTFDYIKGLIKLVSFYWSDGVDPFNELPFSHIHVCIQIYIQMKLYYS